jgi:hypothetical protein
MSIFNISRISGNQQLASAGVQYISHPSASQLLTNVTPAVNVGIFI